ncbi:uncharacterized protein AB675_1438 [Cyphellophora attinorum]|uniref:Uncharacterized protein n=1 Tax=Cyphellophora attinorum TaxID=1664694 RepID=A0A0N1H0B0_9EURO|nr:uncharacterized protein AB675_1438 [Phialophora attinorum]KPI37235.1 hypothetical protein AB675_1438 [Phialophora attinorum]
MHLHEGLAVAGSILYYTLFPFYYIILLLVRLILILLSPVIYLGYVFKEATMIPVRVLAHFEALWYFLGAAVVIGVIFGLGLHYTMRVITVVLKLDRKPEPKHEPAEASEKSTDEQLPREATTTRDRCPKKNGSTASPGASRQDHDASTCFVG